MAADPLRPDRRVEVRRKDAAKPRRQKVDPERIEVKRAAAAHKPKKPVRTGTGKVEVARPRRTPEAPVDDDPGRLEVRTPKPTRGGQGAGKASERSGPTEIRKAKAATPGRIAAPTEDAEVRRDKPDAKRSAGRGRKGSGGPGKRRPEKVQERRSKAAAPRSVKVDEPRIEVQRATRKAPGKRSKKAPEIGRVEVRSNQRKAAPEPLALDHGDVKVDAPRPGRGPRLDVDPGPLELKRSEAGAGPRMDTDPGELDIQAAQGGSGPRLEADGGKLDVQRREAARPRSEPVPEERFEVAAAVRTRKAHKGGVPDAPGKVEVRKPAPGAGPRMDTDHGEVAVREARPGAGPRLGQDHGDVHVEAPTPGSGPRLDTDLGEMEIRRVKPDAVRWVASLSRPRVQILHDEAEHDEADEASLAALKGASVDVRLDTNSVWTPRALRRDRKD